MEVREQAKIHTVAVLAAGDSVEVIGAHGIGKTFFVREIVTHFANLGWKTLEVRGLYPYRNTSFACLSLAGVTSASNGRPVALGPLVAELEALLDHENVLLVLEDAGFIDDASWGALSAVCSRRKIPVLLTRLPGSSRHRVGNQLEGMSIAPGFGIQLGPFGFQDLSDALSRATGIALDSTVMSQVFASSGGNIGLAIKMVKAAVREDRLEQVNGVWHTHGSMWSASLIPYIDALLAALDDRHWDALELLSVLGVVDIDTLIQFTDEDIPVHLEELSLIGFYPSGGRLLVTVQPPLLVDFFRHRPATARRHRLSALLERHLSDGNEELVPFRLAALSSSPDAPFVRLVHEHLRNRLLVAQSEWTRSPSRSTLANLVEVSVASGATQSELESLLADGDSLPADESEAALVRWEQIRADVLLLVSQEYERALAILRAAAARFPRLGPLFTVRIVEVERVVQPHDVSVELPDPSDENLDPRVRAAAHVALATGMLRAGFTTEAQLQFDAAAQLESHSQAVERLGFLIATAYFGGRPQAARAMAEQGLSAAKDSFDNIAIRGFSYLLALLDLLDGREKRAEESIRLAFSLGEPIRQPPFVHLSFLVMGASLAAARGDVKTAQQLQASYETSRVPDGLLPGGTRSWADARILSAQGQPVAGADRAEQGGDALWAEGARLNAGLMYLLALELDLTDERYERIHDRAHEIEAQYVKDRLRFFTAMHERDDRAIAVAAEKFALEEFYSEALWAYEQAARIASAAGRTEEAAQHTRARQALSARMPSGEYRETGPAHRGLSFTARERQIARLAIDGNGNQAIADALVLSVRTVESHMHRIMKKAGVERRGDLTDVPGLA